MHLGEGEIAALFGAALDAENDLFLVSDAPFRPAQANALAAALGRGLVVFLPGDYYPFGLPPARCFFCEPQGSPTRTYRFPPGPFVCWADIRLAGDPAFSDAMEAAAPAAWILPYAACADPVEPGYRESYRYLAELRAASRRFTGIAALFEAPPEAGFYTGLFGSRSAVLLTGAPACGFPAVKTRTEAEKQALALRECEKQNGRTAVFVPTRRQAEAFGRTLLRRQAKSVTVHGGKTHGENALSLARFLAGEAEILCATSHALASAPFLSADRVLCCGLPLSAAYAATCAALLPAGERPLVVFAETDIAFNERLARSRAAAFSLPAADFVARRKALCEALLRQLRF